MNETPAQRAMSAALLSLLAIGACFYFLVSGRLGSTGATPALLGIGMAASLFLHWFFVGVAARRTGRSVGKWVTGAVLGFPIVSIVALVAYYWLEAEHVSTARSQP